MVKITFLSFKIPVKENYQLIVYGTGTFLLL
ncbi:hypothetical protein BH23BAC1_BH23BAC1_11680 [soil metagenome]